MLVLVVHSTLVSPIKIKNKNKKGILVCSVNVVENTSPSTLRINLVHLVIQSTNVAQDAVAVS